MNKSFWAVSAVAGLFMAGISFSTSARADGAEGYKKNCVKCHADDGSGKKDGEWLKVAKTLKLKDPAVLSLLSDEAKKKTSADVEKTILEGVEKDGKTTMKGMKDKMTADEAKAIAAYVGTLQAGKK